jgi:hypothetical protein
MFGANACFRKVTITIPVSETNFSFSVLPFILSPLAKLMHLTGSITPIQLQRQ